MRKHIVSALLVCCALGTAAAQSQTRTEFGGGQKIVHPGLYGPVTGGGDFINPKVFEPQVADGFVYMIVQGTPRNFNHPISASENCLGDELFLYEAPKANNRFLYAEGAGGFAPVARISPCAQPGVEGTSQPRDLTLARAIVNGNPVFSSQEQEYLMVATAAVPKSVSTTGNEEFVEIMLGRTHNQQLDDWTWHSLFEVEEGLFGIAGTYLAPDTSRPPLAGHEYYRGIFRLLLGTANHAAEIRIDLSNSWCGTSFSVSPSTPVTVPGGPCSKVEIRVGNTWKAVQNGLVTAADVAPLGRPDIRINNFAPWGLSVVHGQLELWGTKFLALPVTFDDPSLGCTTPVPNWTVNQVSRFQYYDVASNWSLSGPNKVESTIRCMPGNTRIARSYPWVFQPSGSQRTFLYSVTNDDNRSTATAEFDGAYVIVTAIEDR